MNSHRVLVVFDCTKIRIFYEVTIKILQNKGIVMKSYSQPATAKLAIFRKKTILGDSKLSFFRGLRLILYWILRMNSSVKVENRSFWDVLTDVFIGILYSPFLP